ncbi:hypothetical protein LCGC14_0636090 [marine sediment metagenome]|uniref:Uncharacterized protein n=1 Tax=marine sediment metagenome TaxID=412755 RepID=A0A0F9TM01_9ZZZZ|nr:hypothetical protein [bacterium]
METNFKIHVNMTGKEYASYQNSKKINFRSKSVQGIFIIIASLFFLMIPIFIIANWYSVDTTPAFQGWYDALPVMALLGWDGIGKLTFLYFAPFLVIVIGLAWLIHGFGFLIVRR